MNIEKMRRAQEERDREMDQFLSDIKNTVEKTSSGHINTDVSNYLATGRNR